MNTASTIRQIQSQSSPAQLRRRTNWIRHSRLIVSTHAGTHVIPLQDIICIQSQGRYTHIFRIDGTKLVSSLSLKEIDEKIQSLDFFRIHQRAIVNLEHIRLVRASSVELTDGSILPLAKRRRAAFLEIFQ